MVWLRIVTFCACCITSMSCGGAYFIGFVSNPGGNTSITGRVDAISSGFVSDPGGLTQITWVTFVNSDAATVVPFCGDQQHLFIIDQTVRVDYTPGIVCSVLIRVVVVDDTAIPFSGNPSIQYRRTVPYLDSSAHPPTPIRIRTFTCASAQTTPNFGKGAAW